MRGNQGWSTAGRAGRPKLTGPDASKKRPVHAVRAFDDEWNLIKRFTKLVKRDMKKAGELIKQFDA